MTEKLLHFIWQFRYFNPGSLLTRQGDTVDVIFPGQYNLNQGPDFTAARVKIGMQTWAGTVELHLRTSDWGKHRHSSDKNYQNVILHVVWEDDGGEDHLPLLALQNRVPHLLLEKYEMLMQSVTFIPCENQIGNVHPLTMISWTDSLLADRLTRKAIHVSELLNKNNVHWEEASWWMIARNFGMTVNADAFEAMAKSFSLSILRKHSGQLIQLEALLMGQAGLLETVFTEDYPQMLQKEYRYLKKKYKLETITHPVHFLRMRPGNFPTVRLAQLARLLAKLPQLFGFFRDAESPTLLMKQLEVIANDYWHYHYRFDEPTAYKPKAIGSSMTLGIIINTVAPLLFAYGLFNRLPEYQIKAIKWMEALPAETNAITAGFHKLGIVCSHARDSQALLELKTNWCNQKNCLSCAIGKSVLDPGQS